MSPHSLINKTDNLTVADPSLDRKIGEENWGANEARLLYSTTTIAATTESFSKALEQLLDVICDFVGWPIGHLYLPSSDGKDELEPTSIWHLDDPERFRVFREVTERTKFSPGIGLPGRVMSSGMAAWIPDVQKDANFPRNKLAIDIGVRGAFGFPIKVGKETVAVLEFFTDRREESNSNILRVMEMVGSQIGRVLARERTKVANIEQAEKIRTMNEVARSIAHDIRNPLQAIRLAADLLKDANKDEFQELLDVIDRDVESADRIVKNLMDFSSLRTPSLTSTDINGLIEEVVSQIILPKNVNLTTLYSNLQNLNVDREQLSRVIFNLILNALQSMPNSGGLEISTAKVDRFLEIRIRDSGVGISPDQISKIFDPFYTTKATGTGLGLPTAKRIVEEHKGTLLIASEVGKGTEVTVRLPEA